MYKYNVLKHDKYCISIQALKICAYSGLIYDFTVTQVIMVFYVCFVSLDRPSCNETEQKIGMMWMVAQFLLCVSSEFVIVC